MGERQERRIKPGLGVGVIILNEKREVLLGRRRGEKVGGGTWCLPGGKAEKKELVKVTAARELREETGLQAKDKGKIISVAFETFYGLSYLTIGVEMSAFGVPSEPSPEEIGEWRWYPLDELPEPLFLPTKRILDNFVNKVVYSKKPIT